jgi:orotate phosphoribosyltransferase
MSEEKTIYTITSDRNERVFIHAMPGHFVSSSSHLNFYIGTSDIKHNHDISVDAAMMLARYYHERGIEIDTVLCLYETQALGAFLAHELQRANMLNPNPDSTVYVLGPEYDAQGNIIFRDNLRKLITGKRVLLLISCITSGKTIERAMESVSYYGGETVGISAVFSAINEVDGVEVNKIFSADDVPGYQAYPPHDCPLCKGNQKVDAITNGYGYSLL